MDPRNSVLRLLKDNQAAAAAEMVMVLPFLIALMFGSFELGNYFYNEHIVVKAVRDGARFAARRPFTDYSGCSPSGSLVGDVQNVTRTGQLTAGGTPRLGYWSDASTITVTVQCYGGYSGVYDGQPLGAPVVTVTAAVPYMSLFGVLGLDTTGFNLNAQSQAAVMGI